MEWVRRRIGAKQTLDEAASSSLTVREEYLRKTFFVSVSTEGFAARDYSQLENRFAALRSIATQLKTEIEDNEFTYTPDELKSLNEALASLKDVLSSIEKRLDSERLFSSVENVILTSITRYKASTNRTSTNLDRQAENYSTLKQTVILKVIQQAQASLDIKKRVPFFPFPVEILQPGYRLRG